MSDSVDYALLASPASSALTLPQYAINPWQRPSIIQYIGISDNTETSPYILLGFYWFNARECPEEESGLSWSCRVRTSPKQPATLSKRCFDPSHHQLATQLSVRIRSAQERGATCEISRQGHDCQQWTMTRLTKLKYRTHAI